MRRVGVRDVISRGAASGTTEHAREELVEALAASAAVTGAAAEQETAPGVLQHVEEIEDAPAAYDPFLQGRQPCWLVQQLQLRS